MIAAMIFFEILGQLLLCLGGTLLTYTKDTDAHSAHKHSLLSRLVSGWLRPCMSHCKASYTARRSGVTWYPCCARYYSLFTLGMLVMFKYITIYC